MPKVYFQKHPCQNKTSNKVPGIPPADFISKSDIKAIIQTAKHLPVTALSNAAASWQQGILAWLCLTFSFFCFLINWNNLHVFISELTLSVSVALMSPFFHQHGHTRFRLRLLCLLQFFVWFWFRFAFHPSLGFYVLFRYRGFSWTLWFMCRIVPEAFGQQRKICRLCGRLCLRCTQCHFVWKAGSLEPLGCPHMFIHLLYSRGMEMGSPDSTLTTSFTISHRYMPIRDSVARCMLCGTSEWHPW